MVIFDHIKKLKEKLEQVLAFLLLHFIYFLGIGPTSIVGKLLSKQFLVRKSSSWSKPQYSSKITNQF